MKRVWSVVPVEVRTSRLLAAYLIVGLAGGIVFQPARAIVDYILLAGYAALIGWWLRDDATLANIDEVEDRRPRRDVAVVIVVALLALVAVTWFWFGPGPRQLLFSIRDSLAHAGIDSELAGKMGNAVVGIAFLMLPAALVTFLAGLRPRQVALPPRRIGLGIVLSLIAVAFGFIAVLTGQAPLTWNGHGILLALSLLVVQAGINGLPDEFIFRGIILTRLLALVRNPGTALVLSSVLFSAYHIPSDLSQPGHPPWWIVIPAAIISPGHQPPGLIWAYLCYRARSIWPGVLWHTSSTVFGFSSW
jgi:membrane protease YdiL (CAAX protease family)